MDARCPYCLEAIVEGARKCPHCQSYLDKDIQQRESSQSDRVDLILKTIDFIVRSLTVGGIALAGAAALIGWNSLDNFKKALRDDITAPVQKDVNEKIDKAVSEAKGKIEDAVSEAKGKISALTAASWRSAVDILYVRYKNIIDNLVIESLTQSDLKEISEIRENFLVLINMSEKNSKDWTDLGKDKEEYYMAALEVSRVLDALNEIKEYGSTGDDLHLVKASRYIDSKELHDLQTPMKYRVLFSIYSRQFKKSIAQHVGFSSPPQHGSEVASLQRSRDYLEQLQWAANEYSKRSKSTSANAKLIEAAALAREATFIERYSGDKSKEKAKYVDAVARLREAAILDPSNEAVNYNLAAYYARAEMFDESLKVLKRIKDWGGLSSGTDIEFFERDDDFYKLRKARQDELRKLKLM